MCAGVRSECMCINMVIEMWQTWESIPLMLNVDDGDASSGQVKPLVINCA